MRISVLIAFLFLLPALANGQKWSSKRKYSTRKNTLYIYWGYNRSMYTKSDINFVGPRYNFIAENVAASDRPSNKLNEYFAPNKFTIPQFNVRVGYYYADHWDVSFGYDHMKYVMDPNQIIYLNGHIETSTSELNGDYDQSTGKIPIRYEDLHYENTNGLNYISVQLTNTTPRYETRDRKFAIHQILGGGGGPVLTQTGFNWDGVEYQSGMAITGYGLSVHAGVRFDFFNRFFLMSDWSTGFIHLPHNRTIQNAPDYARQKFVFAQWVLMGGVFFYMPAINGCDSCPDW